MIRVDFSRDDEGINIRVYKNDVLIESLYDPYVDKTMFIRDMTDEEFILFLHAKFQKQAVDPLLN